MSNSPAQLANKMAKLVFENIELDNDMKSPCAECPWPTTDDSNFIYNKNQLNEGKQFVCHMTVAKLTHTDNNDALIGFIPRVSTGRKCASLCMGFVQRNEKFEREHNV